MATAIHDLILTVCLLSAPALAAAPAPSTAPALADAPKMEHEALDRLLGSASWPRRALGAMRLERYGCAESRARLVALLDDPAWQVRAFAVASLGRRREAADPGWFADEDDPRVVRAAQRHRYALAPERLERGVRYLARSSSLSDRLLAVEIAATTDDRELRELATETLREVILRMDRAEGGALSPRIAAVTGQPDLRREHRWKRWYLAEGRNTPLQPAMAVPAGDERPAPTPVAAADPRRFAGLLDYIEDLPKRRVDLAICLDTTASMSGELAEAQGGIDDLMLFGRDVVGGIRVALVAYRDRRDRYETQGWDFTPDVAEARRRLWLLDADGGGDTPEAVEPALRLAYGRLSWQPEHVKVLVLVGDAPPHVGYGEHCVAMAAAAREQAGVITHAIQAGGREVKHFPEIAEAGAGRCVTLEDDDSLIAEIMGLTLGDRYEQEMRSFFGTYLVLCR